MARQTLVEVKCVCFLVTFWRRPAVPPVYSVSHALFLGRRSHALLMKRVGISFLPGLHHLLNCKGLRESC